MKHTEWVSFICFNKDKCNILFDRNPHLHKMEKLFTCQSSAESSLEQCVRKQICINNTFKWQVSKVVKQVFKTRVSLVGLGKLFSPSHQPWHGLSWNLLSSFRHHISRKRWRNWRESREGERRRWAGGEDWRSRKHDIREKIERTGFV